MLAGTVKWFDSLKGYGFIVSADGQDVMVHFTAIETDGFRNLYLGEPVEYETRRTSRGLQATRVRRIKVDGHPRSAAPISPRPPSAANH
jgi:cold shock protein